MLEGFSETAEYVTPYEEYKTIGYGHYCDDPAGADKKYLQNGYKITREEAEELLIQDVGEHYPKEILEAIYAGNVTLYDYQIDVLVSMSFNGISFDAADSPNTRDYLLKGVYSEEETLEHFLTYTIQTKENGEVIVLPGLVKRRVAEAMVF